MKLTGRILLIAGGLGVVISAVIGSDWPMYACIILAAAGAGLMLWSRPG